MAVSRGAIRDLLVPGLAEVEGKYPQIPRQYTEVFEVGYSRLALERVAEMRYTGLAALKQEGSATIFDNAPGERFVYNILMQSFGLGTALTREMLDDNLYKDHFGPMSMGLAESFAQTEEIMGADPTKDKEMQLEQQKHEAELQQNQEKHDQKLQHDREMRKPKRE